MVTVLGGDLHGRWISTPSLFFCPARIPARLLHLGQSIQRTTPSSKNSLSGGAWPHVSAGSRDDLCYARNSSCHPVFGLCHGPLGVRLHATFPPLAGGSTLLAIIASPPPPSFAQVHIAEKMGSPHI